MVWFTSFPPYWFQIIGVTGSKKVGNDATQKYKYKMITVDGFQLIPNEIHRYTVTLLGYMIRLYPYRFRSLTVSNCILIRQAYTVHLQSITADQTIGLTLYRYSDR